MRVSMNVIKNKHGVFRVRKKVQKKWSGCKPSVFSSAARIRLRACHAVAVGAGRAGRAPHRVRWSREK